MRFPATVPKFWIAETNSEGVVAMKAVKQACAPWNQDF